MASSPDEPAPPPLLGAHCCLSTGDWRLALKAENGADAGEGSSSLPRGRLRSPLSPLSKSLQTIACASLVYFSAAAHPTTPTPARPASRIRFQAFLFLFQLATILIPPPCHATLPALQSHVHPGRSCCLLLPRLFQSTSPISCTELSLSLSKCQFLCQWLIVKLKSEP